MVCKPGSRHVERAAYALPKGAPALQVNPARARIVLLCAAILGAGIGTVIVMWLRGAQ
jgi:hypothetical protein